jgi:hypothetical protein
MAGSKKSNLSASFVENHSSINDDDAMELLVKAEKRIRALTDERNNDAKLTAAKQIKHDLESSYNSAINYEKAKVNFFLEKIDELRGEGEEVSQEDKA